MGQGQYLKERLLLSLVIGFVRTLRGDPRKGKVVSKQAGFMARDLNDPSFEAIALSYLVDALVFLGEHEEAAETLRYYENLVERNKKPGDTNRTFFFVPVFFHIYSGDKDLARQNSDEAMMSVEKYGLVHYYPIVLFAPDIMRGEYMQITPRPGKKGELLANMSESMGAVLS